MGELASHCGEAVEGKVSLIMQEFLVQGKEAFRSMDGSRLGCVFDIRWCHLQKADHGEGISLQKRCGVRMKVQTSLNKIVGSWRGMVGDPVSQR